MNKFVLSTFFAGALWGTISLFINQLTDLGFSMPQIVFYRTAFATIFLLIFLLFYNPSLLKIQLKDLWMFLGTGIVSLTFFSLCYFRTIINCGPGIAVILLYTSPIFVLLLSLILFHEKMNLLKIIALIMTFAGIILVTGLGSSRSLNGKSFIIGLCAGLGYALYSIFSRYALKKYHSFTIIFYTFLFCTISIAPFSKLPSSLPLFAGCSGKAVIFCIGIALVCTALPYIFYTLGLTGLETGKAAILVTVEPLVGTLIGIFVFGEQISVAKVTGILLIFAAVIMLGMKKEE